jgi:MFS family permease
MSVPTQTRSHSGEPIPEQLTAGRRKVVLWICCMSVLIVGIDQTIVNVALPSIQRALHASLTDLQWVVAAYTQTVACLLMLSASRADRFGRKARLPDWPGAVLRRIAALQPRT